MSGTTLFNTRHVSNSASQDYLRGLGSVMNIRGNTHREYDFVRTAEEADRVAIAGDWIVVGEDLTVACEHVRRGRH